MQAPVEVPILGGTFMPFAASPDVALVTPRCEIDANTDTDVSDESTDASAVERLTDRLRR
ncbi:hypothetical protein [Pandoraea bronchicola]|uniref:hypothetical protein n=1 Tax=Pandoraea bronchicola TaxID=2508287 RepID=UPI00123FB623|nr:hypothetical protein [Pandoraea bronchicola]